MRLFLGERPRGWEYLLFSHALIEKLERLDDLYRDVKLGFSIPQDYLSDDAFVDVSQRELARITALTNTFERLLSGSAQQDAFGASGVSGDPGLIDHFASRLVRVYEELLNWTDALRSWAPASEEAASALFALSNFAQQPIESMREFVYKVRADMDTLHARIEAEKEIAITLTIAYEISDETLAAHQAALAAFEAHREARG